MVEKEVQTEAELEVATDADADADAVSRISVGDEISAKEEKETSTEKVSTVDSSIQTDFDEAGILADRDLEARAEVAEVARPSEESRRISACTQTQLEEGVTVCEAEVQTDAVADAADEREGHRTRSFLGSPTDELVT